MSPKYVLPQERKRLQARLEELKGGLTVPAFAKRIGVAKSVAYTWWQQGAPNDATRERICQTFGIRRPWLDAGQLPKFVGQGRSDAELADDLAAYVRRNSRVEPTLSGIDADLFAGVSGRGMLKRAVKAYDEHLTERVELFRESRDLQHALATTPGWDATGMLDKKTTPKPKPRGRRKSNTSN